VQKIKYQIIAFTVTVASERETNTGMDQPPAVYEKLYGGHEHSWLWVRKSTPSKMALMSPIFVNMATSS